MSKNTFAQNFINLPFYDEKKLHYGLYFGFHQSNFKHRHSDKFVADDTITQIIGNKTPGFTIGLIINYNFKSNDLWDLRVMPSVTIYDRMMEFHYKTGFIDASQKYNSTFLDIPVNLKFKSLRRHNHRLYMTSGFTYGREVGGVKAPDNLNILANKRNYLEINYGFGADLYLSYFKFAPEIRFSHGLNNFLYDNDSDYSQYLDKIRTFRIALILNFE